VTGYDYVFSFQLHLLVTIEETYLTVRYRTGLFSSQLLTRARLWAVVASAEPCRSIQCIFVVTCLTSSCKLAESHIACFNKSFVSLYHADPNYFMSEWFVSWLFSQHTNISQLRFLSFIFPPLGEKSLVQKSVYCSILFLVYCLHRVFVTFYLQSSVDCTPHVNVLLVGRQEAQLPYKVLLYNNYHKFTFWGTQSQYNMEYRVTLAKFVSYTEISSG